jgi:molybdate transport system regulatory protein
MNLSCLHSAALACRQMNTSYMHAWLLIREMNSCFKNPPVVTKRGGVKGGGGAQLTETGLRVLALYRNINAKFFRVTRAERNRLQLLLR